MQEEQPKKKRKWLLWTMILSILLFLLSPFMVYRARNAAAFRSRVRALAEAGYPTSLDDLEKDYVLPEGAENAADVYLEAFRLYTEPNEHEKEFLPVRGNFKTTDDMPPYPPEVMDTIKASLDKNRQTLDLLDKAARMEHCLFPRKRNGIWLQTEYISELKKASQLLTEQNLYLAQTGQTDDLFESTLTSINLSSNSLSRQPLMIDHLVAVAMQALTAAGIEDSLNMTTYTEEQLAVLQQQMYQMRQNNTMQTTLIPERVEIIEIYNLPVADQVKQVSYYNNNLLEKLVFIPYDLSGIKHKDGVLLLDFYDQYYRAFELPLHEQYIAFQRIKDKQESYSFVPHWFLHVFSSYTRIVEINLRVIGNLQCAETALAIERYRLKYQQLPMSLEALVPEFLEEVPIDPFDGNPIRCILHESGGYTVYIIGEDGIDNGGLDREQMTKKTGKKDEHDWPFTVNH